ncbi:unnamed protein product [Adineta ricciae]|uniref:Uncharacterized protein n=1 Tax=Adineta ricciae TaxID=249248 RepID=A0A814ZVH9_ADIRI|nr:unnamed protein product [Adineta ricciae]
MSFTINGSSIANNSYCSAVFYHICWPQTLAGQSANVSCAALLQEGVDTTKFVTRHCLPSGNWSNINFEQCFYPDVWALLVKSFLVRPQSEREIFPKLVRFARYGELGGLSLSLTTVLISLFIFFTFRTLYCERTKIHVNLLLAILIQTIARLSAYAFQMVSQNSPGECNVDNHLHSSLGRSLFSVFCPLITVLLQFGKTAMFMWMLCEGIQLNNVLTVGVFKNYFKTLYFHILGWFLPFCITLSWTIVMVIKQRERRCFYNYNHLIYYWIIDGPRYAVMIINIIFLLNILRVLMVKMKEGSEKQVREEQYNTHRNNVVSRIKHFTHRRRRASMHAKFVRQTVKAAIFLLPLLGITHVLETFVSAYDKPITIFAIYCCVNVILVAPQGFYCALFYCFLNAEVQETLKRRFQTTQLWHRWKKYSGDKNSYPNETPKKENQSCLDLKTLDSKSIKNDELLKSEQHPLTSTIDEIQ